MKKRTAFIIPVKHSSAVRDDWVSAALASEKRGGGALHPVQSYSIWRTCERVVVSEAGCMCTYAHLSACMHELSGSPPQALGCRLGMQP